MIVSTIAPQLMSFDCIYNSTSNHLVGFGCDAKHIKLSIEIVEQTLMCIIKDGQNGLKHQMNKKIELITIQLDKLCYGSQVRATC